jgi:hypothetical protein
MKSRNEKRNTTGKLFIQMGFVVLLLGSPNLASAHCDSYDGPVIKDAYKAIHSNDVQPVLKWVKAEHEGEIKNLFNKILSLKGSDQEIYAMVEKYFLETLVRLHREGEGAPYTGLKPAGTTKPIIVLTDAALANKDIDGLSTKVKSHFDKVLRDKYNEVVEATNKKEDSVEKGKEYVEAYVEYTHFVEALHEVIEYGSAGHGHQH